MLYIRKEANAHGERIPLAKDGGAARIPAP